MISSGDTMAGSLWHARLEYANTSCLESKQTTQLQSSIEVSPSNNDVSELPYLCTDLVETKGVEYASLPTMDSLDSDIDTAFLLAMLSGDDTGIEGMEYSVCSRPVLYINPVSLVGDMVLSAPSPVDSGYGSRPATPSVETCGEYESDESSWSPADDTFSLSDESSNTHTPFSDANYWNHVTDAKVASPAPQGPVIPRIILSDPEGRVAEVAIDDQFDAISLLESSPVDEDADSPYGGLMSLAAPGDPEPASLVSCVYPVSNLRHSATGTVLDRAFVSLIRPRTTPSVITPVYHNRHRAPTFVLDCVGEEEEEQRDEQKCVRALFVLEEEQDECAELEMMDGDCSVIGVSVDYDGAECLLDEEPSAGSSRSTLVSGGKNEFNTWHFEDGEDDECEECGLFLTEPDDGCHRLVGDLSRLPNKPAVAFGLLKVVARARPTNDLNTAYHVTVEGCTFRTNHASCSYDCERGYWSNSNGVSSIIYPHDCPAHGGRDACEVGAIFHHSALRPPTIEPDFTATDYQTLAAEIVGLPPAERKSVEEDLDDGDLILHSGEKFRPTENKSAPPKAGASYDDYMSRFMDDVDLPTNGSSDNFKNAPFGKLVGGALKDMTVPEAVDHLKEGFEKTESAFRAALSAPFRFNSVADKLTQHLKSGDSKVHPPKERRGSNAFRHHRKESSVSGIKTKWSNMLNKFTR
ncbi:unnamed protein product [Rhizoctonia solani]|uniref:Uncharacterized protein n=3 Tax=Rhizoctonia solani TaxID=456999 RepID=A0A8H3HKH8_9AGAM|nr:hypothetical protein RSOL_321560 [Rhizoctonia solani AG-3 Rhs1AP]KEP51304.1 hypothetical protein V565_063840 [Rhizoctonia solani 123E]CAE6516120.1 unnamed protein product [Rhizoctonia solani]CAE6529702.1 unnamed protein product [Rhizoctonia solani]